MGQTSGPHVQFFQQDVEVRSSHGELYLAASTNRTAAYVNYNWRAARAQNDIDSVFPYGNNHHNNHDHDDDDHHNHADHISVPHVYYQHPHSLSNHKYHHNNHYNDHHSDNVDDINGHSDGFPHYHHNHNHNNNYNNYIVVDNHSLGVHDHTMPTKRATSSSTPSAYQCVREREPRSTSTW